jgi:hypothetical protein
MIVTLAIGLSPCGAGQNQRWPGIRPTRIAVAFRDARRADTTFVIRGTDGKPLYRVACHTSAYAGDPDFDYSGDFECRMISLYSTDAHSTLLTDDANQSRDWQSRGRFLAEELIGACGSYPEYGLTRHFRLRGMKVTLALTDPVFDTVTAMTGVTRVGLRSFRFEVAAEPDSAANTPIAEPPAFAEPLYTHPQDPRDLSKDCRVVRHREG